MERIESYSPRLKSQTVTSLVMLQQDNDIDDGEVLHYEEDYEPQLTRGRVVAVVIRCILGDLPAEGNPLPQKLYVELEMEFNLLRSIGKQQTAELQQAVHEAQIRTRVKFAELMHSCGGKHSHKQFIDAARASLRIKVDY